MSPPSASFVCCSQLLHSIPVIGLIVVEALMQSDMFLSSLDIMCRVVSFLFTGEKESEIAIEIEIER